MVNLLNPQKKMSILAFDQTFEVGPSVLNNFTMQPKNIVNLANNYFDGIAMHSGLYERYGQHLSKDILKIIKLNGKTSLKLIDAISLAHTSIDYALHLGANAIGYTVYLGSDYEHIQLEEAGRIIEECKRKSIPIILWVYTKGRGVPNEFDTNVIKYAVCVGQQLGADLIKIKLPLNIKDIHEIVQVADELPILFAGGKNIPSEEFMKSMIEVKNSKAAGIAVGRNIFENSNPELIAKNISQLFML